MKCRKRCGACCIVISILSPLPNMPEGKPAGVKCVNLDEDYSCKIHSLSDYPEICKKLIPSAEMCGKTRDQAMEYLRNLEKLTRPGKR